MLTLSAYPSPRCSRLISYKVFALMCLLFLLAPLRAHAGQWLFTVSSTGGGSDTGMYSGAK